MKANIGPSYRVVALIALAWMVMLTGPAALLPTRGRMTPAELAPYSACGFLAGVLSGFLLVLVLRRLRSPLAKRFAAVGYLLSAPFSVFMGWMTIGLLGTGGVALAVYSAVWATSIVLSGTLAGLLTATIVEIWMKLLGIPLYVLLGLLTMLAGATLLVSGIAGPASQALLLLGLLASLAGASVLISKLADARTS